MNYTVFLIAFSFFLPIHSMEQNVISRVVHHLDLSSISRLLRTCTAHYNVYSKGISFKTAQRFFEHYDQVSQDDLLSVQFGIDRLLQQNPSLCRSFNEDDHVTALVHYAHTNHRIMFQHIIANENTTNKAQRVTALEFFMYLNENGTIACLDDINDITSNINAYKAISKYDDCMLDANIHHAIQKNILYVVKLFIKNKVDLHGDRWSHTVLQSAIGTQNQQLVLYLIDHGAYVSHYQRNKCPLEYAINCCFEMVQLLIINNTITITQEHRSSALRLAVISKYENIVQLLLDNGVDINYADSSGNTALHHAVSRDYFSIAQMLVKHGINIAAENSYGKTAYDYIIVGKNFFKFKELLAPEDSCIIS